MTAAVKICGVRTPEAVRAAADKGARYIGLNFYAASPRAVDVLLAWELSKLIPTGVRSVGVFVDPGLDELERVLSQVPLDMIQLHGREGPDQVAALKERLPVQVIKALPVGDAGDIDRAAAYDGAADMLLFDAKPPPGVQSLPGGNALALDWSLFAGRRVALPWLLAGGLTADNVAVAIRVSGALGVDVASGVEDRPGHKDPTLIGAFMDAVAAAE